MQVVLRARIPEQTDSIRISHAIFLMLLAEIIGTFKAFTYEHSCEKQRIDSGTEGLTFELFSHDCPILLIRMLHSKNQVNSWMLNFAYAVYQ